MNTDDLRILELGDRSLFTECFPDNTLLLWTGLRAIEPSPSQRNFNLSAAWLLLKSLRQDDFDLIVCYPPLHNPLGIRWMLRVWGRSPLLFPLHWFRTMGVVFLRFATAHTKTPIVVLDTEDITAINRHNIFLFPRCRAFFKRELPPDFWTVFFKTAHPSLPNARFRRNPFFARCIAKLRPLSLGIGEGKVRQIAALPIQGLPEQKSVDVFFAGTVDNSSVRVQGIEQLKALRDEGYVIDLAEPNLPPNEYFTRCARAWLTWSPEGYGWDCFRHYEAAICRSVPLMNQPTIHRYQPLRDGLHGLYYDVEGEGLKTAIMEALSDKPRLAGIAEAAREHVLRYHTHQSLCEHVLEVALSGSK